MLLRGKVSFEARVSGSNAEDDDGGRRDIGASQRSHFRFGRFPPRGAEGNPLVLPRFFLVDSLSRTLGLFSHRRVFSTDLKVSDRKKRPVCCQSCEEKRTGTRCRPQSTAFRPPPAQAAQEASRSSIAKLRDASPLPRGKFRDSPKANMRLESKRERPTVDVRVSSTLDLLKVGQVDSMLGLFSRCTNPVSEPGTWYSPKSKESRVWPKSCPPPRRRPRKAGRRAPEGKRGGGGKGEVEG